MKKNIAYLLLILAVVMIYLGGFHMKKVILPPIITGIGFIAIALGYLKE